ncbi:MAG: Wzz/FepE/Etk N-terminal domain-containing protein, partial [Thermus sp.]
MVEAPADELSLRDILEILKRQRVWILALPLVFGVLALIYG